jgi:hypothetical protein
MSSVRRGSAFFVRPLATHQTFMSTQRIEIPDVIHSMLDKIPDLEKRVAYYESIYPDLPERYEQAQAAEVKKQRDGD